MTDVTQELRDLLAELLDRIESLEAEVFGE